MASDSSMEEFLEDFGSTPLAENELDSILEAARQKGDAPIRRAVKELRTLRWLGRILLDRVETHSLPPDDQVVKIARFLVRGEHRP